ncbi:hypothetical protein FDP41_000624 [Naegleria fowleri]|uniref:Uncharacterized protein n=1 Tax=Naegleria fowleri TaxID=5763 RepID=A0A6A5CHF3_NAEFO|nr:uncharacterized protein FDP41_000624 [Naegleria fowleri]KAF0984725.1 hypothetical protein FDP41_000624 [Naegleria fowleri]CAG4716639.1 unnamed protein product [Naegleria fowleri]
MVLYRYGGLARAGKVKAQTPRVPKDESSTTHKYNGGRNKLKQRSKNNRKYKSGANRLEALENPSPNTDTDLSISSDQNGHYMQQAPHYLSNSLHKFNTIDGLNRLEFKWAIIRNKRLHLKAEAYYDRNNKNHKKWHRNHPRDGFYQFRHVFENDEEYTSEEENYIEEVDDSNGFELNQQ